MYIQNFCISYIQKILSNVKNRESIIKNTKSYIYRHVKWSRDNSKVKLRMWFYLRKWSFHIHFEMVQELVLNMNLGVFYYCCNIRSDVWVAYPQFFLNALKPFTFYIFNIV